MALDANQQVAALNKSPAYLGTVTATTAKDNSNTATPFTIPAGCNILLQSDSACYFLCQTVAATAVTSSTGVLIAANAERPVILRKAEGYVSILPVSGTSNVKVWSLE